MIEVGLNYKLGGTKFPAYICFHSYLVGAEVLRHRQYVQKINKSTNCHGDTARILRLSKFFENAIEQNLQLFTKNQLRFKLKKNQILILDNRITLHGRTSFAKTEKRIFYRYWMGQEKIC